MLTPGSMSIVSESRRTRNAIADDLARELTHVMVEIDAGIVRMRRSLPPESGFGAHLRDLDEAFARPIALARKLVVAVYANHGRQGVRASR